MNQSNVGSNNSNIGNGANNNNNGNGSFYNNNNNQQYYVVPPLLQPNLPYHHVDPYHYNRLFPSLNNWFDPNYQFLGNQFIPPQQSQQPQQQHQRQQNQPAPQNPQ